MIFNPLKSASAEEKIKTFEAFNDPSNMFTKEIKIDDFTASNRDEMENELNAIEEDKQQKAIQRASREQESLIEQINKPFGQPIITPLATAAPIIKVPYKPSKSLIDFNKYDKDEIAKKVINKIDSSNYNNADRHYLKILGARESDFRKNAGKGQYKGIYQFNTDSLSMVGIKMQDYLNDEEIQFDAALKYRDANLNQLKDYQKYIGQIKDGVLVTRNGLGAMAHLLGAGTVRDYFDETKKTKLAQKGFKDGNGTHISEYLRMFAQ